MHICACVAWCRVRNQQSPQEQKKRWPELGRDAATITRALDDADAAQAWLCHSLGTWACLCCLTPPLLVHCMLHTTVQLF